MFRHTDYSYEEVGIQVPVGSIRPGETPEATALGETSIDGRRQFVKSAAHLRAAPAAGRPARPRQGASTRVRAARKP